ncbi:MAG: hypothetical protein WBW71_09260 [Bacteroidota bacterium]
MTLSILAVCFLLMLIAIIFYGYGFIMKSARPAGEQNMEPCTICRKKFDRRQLVEREIGDSKLIYFCTSCIMRLYEDVSKV